MGWSEQGLSKWGWPEQAEVLNSILNNQMKAHNYLSSYKCVLIYIIFFKKRKESRVVVAHTFDPSTWEAEAGGFLSLRPAWSIEWVPGQPGLYRETLSWKSQKKKKKIQARILLPNLQDNG